jgi:hypothetical protein
MKIRDVLMDNIPRMVLPTVCAVIMPRTSSKRCGKARGERDDDDEMYKYQKMQGP